MYSIMKKVADHRLENPPQPGDELVVDAILSLDLPEESKMSDMVSVMVAGFHTTGLCEYRRPC